MRKDIRESKGNLDSFRGGILVPEDKKALVRDLYRRIQEAEKPFH